jgi:hypothetical protein
MGMYFILERKYRSPASSARRQDVEIRAELAGRSAIPTSRDSAMLETLCEMLDLLSKYPIDIATIVFFGKLHNMYDLS